MIVARGESKYAGFYEGEWLEPERLGDAVSYALRQAEQSWGRQIKEVFAGVPGEFTSVTVGEAANQYRFKNALPKMMSAKYTKKPIYSIRIKISSP